MNKMKMSFWAVAVVLLVSACGSSNEQSQDLEVVASETMGELSGNVDVAASTVSWKGVMLGVKEHTGTLVVKEGSLKTEAGKIVAGKFTIDMTTITPTDKNYNAEEGTTPAKLVGHLSSPDFFDVDNNPTSSFEVTGSTDGVVNGILTIRGKSNPESINITSMTKENGAWVIQGSITFDRKKYDVAFDHPMQEMVISDVVEVTVKLVVS